MLHISNSKEKKIFFALILDLSQRVEKQFSLPLANKLYLEKIR